MSDEKQPAEQPAEPAGDETPTFRFSYTQLAMYARCGEQYRRRYVKDHRLPPGLAMLRGRGQSRAQELDLKAKLEKGELLEDDAVLDIARDTVKEQLAHGEVMFNDDEKAAGIEKSKSATVDQAVRLAGLHHGQVAPKIEPLHVEARMVMRIPGLKRQITSYADVIEKDGRIRDTKTTKKSPSKDAAERSDQLTVYSLAFGLATGKPSPEQQLDHLVDLKTPKVVTLKVRNTRADHVRIANKMNVAMAGIEQGVFPPAPSDAWWCSRKWCGYYDSCPYVRGGAAILAPELQGKLKIDGDDDDAGNS